MDDIGAKFEISIDGTPRTYRDTSEIARKAAEVLKRRNPSCKVAVRDSLEVRLNVVPVRTSPFSVQVITKTFTVSHRTDYSDSLKRIFCTVIASTRTATSSRSKLEGARICRVRLTASMN